MVDRRRRDQYAELLRHFAAGLLSNVEYEDQADVVLGGTRDIGLCEISRKAWFLYDDVRIHRLRGRWALSPETRHEIARWVAFLYTDCEYEWPEEPLLGCLWQFATLGIWGKVHVQRLHRVGDFDVWPFFREADLDRARTRPRLLSGAP